MCLIRLISDVSSNVHLSLQELLVRRASPAVMANFAEWRQQFLKEFFLKKTTHQKELN